MRGRLLLGTSGYVYPHWRRRFYPADLPAREWLPFYARHFQTVELNNPFEPDFGRILDQIQTYGYVAESTGGSETESTGRRPLDSLAGRVGDWAEPAQTVRAARRARRTLCATHGCAES